MSNENFLSEASWEEFSSTKAAEGDTAGSAHSGEVPNRGAVFVSYALADKEAAKRLCDGLRKAGCDVWLDESELEPGENNASIMEQAIRWDCCAFISIISRHTEENSGFFHRERVWARDRARYGGDAGDFYLPVVVDPGLNLQQLRREPLPAHYKPTVVTLPGGELTNEFCNFVLTMQRQFWSEESREEFGSSKAAEKGAAWSADSRKAPNRGAVFISYAREDKEVAKRLCDGLRKAGCDVWLDESEPQPGENYASIMEQAIRWDCCAFISIISGHTERYPGFFHQERIWARKRENYEGNKGDFYMPVVVDPDLNLQQIRREPLPEQYKPNIVTLPGGESTSEFCNRVLTLQLRFREHN